MMRAALYDRYGKADVVEVRETPRPAPGASEVLVRVHAAALNPKDIVIRSGRWAKLTGRRFPRGVGFDFAGEVVGVGRGAKRLREGDRVYGMRGGLRGGTCAEYVTLREASCAHAPRSLSYEEAASLPLAGLTALQALRDRGKLPPSGAVCINGASGGVGVHAIQVARALGARVTSISSARNLDLCRSLGAETTLDYGKDALFDEQAAFDVVLDCFGNRTLAEVEPALRPGGVFVSMVPKPGRVLDVVRSLGRSRRARFVIVSPSARDLETLSELVEAGSLRPVIDRVHPLEEVGDAMRHLESKRARGKVVIRV